MPRAMLVALLALAALPGSVGAGSYIPPPGDCCPQWSPSGTQLVFTTNRTTGIARTPTVGEVSSSGGPDHYFPGIPVGLRSPDWTHVAYSKEKSGAPWLAVSKPDGGGEQLLAALLNDSAIIAWAPDSSRIFFTGSDDSTYSVHPDGSNTIHYPANVRGVPSPDGSRFAYTSGGAKPAIHAVKADGSADRNLTPGGGRANVGPVWSPDGSRLAFWSSDGKTARLVVARLNGTTRSYAITGAVTNGSIVWAPDGHTVLGAGKRGLVGIELASVKRRLLAGIDGGLFSPDGTHLAFAAGDECNDRTGIYVANADGTAIRRLSNDCRVVGTAGPDVLHGSFSQIVLGLGGNDRLYADDPGTFFEGDTLNGGPGNDVLIGGYARDTLIGGPGNDTLRGGPSADILVGGPGHDHIYGQGGGDVIRAADGQRDWISCGPSGYGKAGRDIVYADSVDVVASDCEVVHRS